uniref:LRR-RLK n=1 Tax=Rhizophora mucronata TaxID=61149 RepID=A0A2P2IKF0_RHIMU
MMFLQRDGILDGHFLQLFMVNARWGEEGITVFYFVWVDEWLCLHFLCVSFLSFDVALLLAHNFLVSTKCELFIFSFFFHNKTIGYSQYIRMTNT